MTLRTRLLITFIALGAVPLMVVGWITNQRNLRAVEDLVARETHLVAEKVSGEIGERYDARLGEVLFLAGNEETFRLFGEGSLPTYGLDPRGPAAFLEETWEELGGRYRWVQFRDADGRALLHLPSGDSIDRGSLRTPSHETIASESSGAFSDPNVFLFSETILSPAENIVLGTVSASVQSASLLPANLPDRGFGEQGFVAVIDTRGNRVLYHPQLPVLSQPLSELLPISEEDLQSVSGGEGHLEYTIDEEVWIGSLLPIRGTNWAVLSSSPLQGFARPFRNVARANLLLVFTITALAAMAFLISTHRTTRSLVDLTNAAREVAEGDLDPDLPPAGRDEAGVLSGAFRTMLARIRHMIMQVEENRQMAAVGEFSAQIAHELRNPLTAVRIVCKGCIGSWRDRACPAFGDSPPGNRPIGPGGRRSLEPRPKSRRGFD